MGATLRDVGRLAGVDASVVSRVLNGDHRLSVRAATRDRIVRAARELSYTPNVNARSLRDGRAGVLGLLVPSFINPVYAPIIEAAETRATQLGLVLLSGFGDSLRSSRDVRRFGGGRVDGLAIIGRVPGKHASELHRLGVPLVYVNTESHVGAPGVVLDDRAITALAVEHLVSLGHRRIGLIGGPVGVDSARRRRIGFSAALRSAGIEAESAPVVDGKYSLEGGCAAMVELLAGGPHVTGVVAANVVMAIGALHGAWLLRKRVPQEVSLITIHDVPAAEYSVPSLTTVATPLNMLGVRAVDLLVAEEEESAATHIVKGNMRVMVRESTGAPPV